MKNIFKIFVLLIVAFSNISCTDDRDPVLGTESSQPQFKSAPTGTYTVTELNLPNTFETFVIAPPVYNVSTEIIYQLEIAEAGTNFANLINLGATTSDKYVKITYSQINNAVLALGATNGVPFTVDVRIRSNIKNNSNYKYSSSATFTIVPFVFGPTYSFTDLYLIGDATAAGWDNNANNMKMFPLQKDLNNANLYTYTGYFAIGGFKILPTKGDWTNQYGYDSPGVLAVNNGGSGNIPISSAGYYKLTVNLGNATYNLVPVATPTTTYSAVSIIGTVNGNWNNDTDLTQSVFNPHIWYVNSTLNDGEFKFRANHDWTSNWGSSKEFFGIGTNGGSNIPLSVGWSYNIYFNDVTGEYTLIPVF